MGAIVGLFSLGVIAVMFSQTVAKGSQGPAVLKAVGGDITSFYSAL